MSLEEHTLPEAFERRCEICGVELTEAEIAEARDAATGPFLCRVHATETIPAVPDEGAVPPEDV